MWRTWHFFLRNNKRVKNEVNYLGNCYHTKNIQREEEFCIWVFVNIKLHETSSLFSAVVSRLRGSVYDFILL